MRKKNLSDDYEKEFFFKRLSGHEMHFFLESKLSLSFELQMKFCKIGLMEAIITLVSRFREL